MLSHRRGKNINLSSGWSDWIWSEDGYWYSTRYDINGELEYKRPNAKEYSALQLTNATRQLSSPNIPSALPLLSSYSQSSNYGYTNDYPSTSPDTIGLPATTDYATPPSSSFTAHSLPAAVTHSGSGEFDGLVKKFSDTSLHTDSTDYPAGKSNVPYTTGFHASQSHGAGEQEFEIIQTPSRFFKVGRVFKAFWTEPAGDTSDNEVAFVTSSKYGQKAFSKVRHFVVLREMERCSLCLSLNTFNRRGTTKPGVRPEDYAAVYPVGGRPQIQAGEGLVKESFPIIVENPKEAIDPMSRLNFSRVYTVEHNLRAMKVGRIPDENLPLLSQYFGIHIAGLPELASDGDDRAIQHPQQFAYSSSESGPSSRYKVVEAKKQNKFFKVGRVFLTLWTEPARENAGMLLPSSVPSHFSPNYLGGTAFTEIRRYVIIQEGYGNSLCCPIHTYGGLATLKPNLPDARQHAIIYTSNDPPDEYWYTADDGSVVAERLIKDPIKVRREQAGPEGDLGLRSRINYSKIYTVEHYNKVLNIGMVDPHSISTLTSNSLVRRDDAPEKPRNYPSKRDWRKDKDADRGGIRKYGKERGRPSHMRA